MKTVMAGMAAALLLLPLSATAQEGVLNDVIEFSGASLHLTPYAQVPSPDFRINSIVSTRPDDPNPYVITENGRVYSMAPNGDNTGSLSVWFDMQSALTGVPDVSFNGGGGQRALQSVAFHPEFDQPLSPGYGKFYTSFVATRPTDPSAFQYLGASTNGSPSVNEDSVLSEWTYDFNSGQSDGYRELFRIELPVYEHPIKQAQFNPYSMPGDEDYGLLYVGHGDSGDQDPFVYGGGQNTDDALGKVLRINPLQAGANAYSVVGNQFATDGNPNTLAEVYAMGFRNPHNMSFNQGSSGNSYLVVGDIGRGSVEEVNVIDVQGDFGGNFGWGDREGPFVQQGGVGPLPQNEWELNDYTYPAAAFDHDSGGGVAIASSFVINNGSDPALQNQFIYTNFSGQDGDFYHSDWNEMLQAHTQLADNETPDQLSRAVTRRLTFELDHDNDPETPPQVFDDFSELVNGAPGARTDTRFGQGFNGEMYVSSKRNGTIYLATNTLPQNQLRLTVDRSTGIISLSKTGGGDVQVDGLTLFSTSGSLDPSQLQGIDSGWTLSASNTPISLTQLLESGVLAVTNGDSYDIGGVYTPVLAGFGEALPQDIQFLYTGPEGELRTGFVEYTGEHRTANTVVLTVDLATGRVSMQNQTPFAQEIDAYTITSASGSLVPGEWNTLEAQGVDDGDWSASPAQPTMLTELQEDGTTTFDDSSPFLLGSIFQNGGSRDLQFEFLLSGEEIARVGAVRYILAGDYNNDGVVDSVDYAVWREGLGQDALLANDLTPGAVTQSDFDVWLAAYGSSLDGALGTNGLPVPEPASAFFSLLLVAGAATLRPKGRRPVFREISQS